MNYMEIRNLAFHYGEKTVFSSVNLEVRRGEIFCLVGPNGCGKTTLQHCILNLLQPQEGEIRIENREIHSYRERELAAKLAYVPQSHTPTFPYLTLDVVAMGGLRSHSLLGGNDRENRDRAMELLTELGIGQLAQVPYTTLSGGEMQLVMIARALCQNSDMLVLDEPTAHLDLGRSQDILSTIARINRQKGITILMATHDFNQPLFFEDIGNAVRMALMSDGEIRRVETPSILLNSDTLKDIYDIHSRVIEVDTGRVRHFLVTWKDEME